MTIGIETCCRSDKTVIGNDLSVNALIDIERITAFAQIWPGCAKKQCTRQGGVLWLQSVYCCQCQSASGGWTAHSNSFCIIWFKKGSIDTDDIIHCCRVRVVRRHSVVYGNNRYLRTACNEDGFTQTWHASAENICTPVQIKKQTFIVWISGFSLIYCFIRARSISISTV